MVRILVAFICLLASMATAQHREARERLILLTASDASGQSVGQVTGFFISEDGFILSSTHLFGQATPEERRALRLTGEIGGAGGRKVRVNFLTDAPNVDLMLLRAVIPWGEESPPHFTIGSTAALGDETDFYTSGFASGRWVPDRGELFDRSDRDLPFVWAIGTTARPGQSGSPVYLEDGETVVGVVWGALPNASDYTLMTPIEYAMPLIGHVKIAELEARLDRLESTRPAAATGARILSGTVRPEAWQKGTTEGFASLWAWIPLQLADFADPKVFISVQSSGTLTEIRVPTVYTVSKNGFGISANLNDYGSADLIDLATRAGLEVNWLVIDGADR